MDMSAYLVAPLQLEKICRACLTEKSDMKPLYGTCLNEMLISFASIQMQQDDGLPSLLCEQCVLQCSNAYTFKQLCKKSDRILREFIKPEFQIQLQNSVMPVLFKIEVDENSELDRFNEMANEPIQHEIKSEFVSCADLDLKPDLVSIKQDEQKPNVRVETPRPPPASKELKCKTCGGIFPTKVDLKVHLMTHPKEPHICTVCSKAFADSSHLKRHSYIHLDKKPYQCDQCDMSFGQKSNLERHKKTHTGELRNIVHKSHLCSVCNKTFKYSSNLNKHMRYHTGLNLFSCDYCNQKFVEANRFKIHVRTHTVKQPYSCDICKKTFTDASNLEDHARVHTGEKPHFCPICGKGFAQSEYVKVHMGTHTGDRPFICQTCGKAYLSLQSLTIHERVHTGDGPHKCETCGKGLSSRESLNRHTRTHTGIKSHFCDVCGKGFNTSGNLSEHKETHGGERSRVCNVCGKTFASVSRLGMHMKSHLEVKKEPEDVGSHEAIDEVHFLEDDSEAVKRNSFHLSRRQSTT